MHGGAVTLVSSAGSTWPCAADEDEDEDDELLLLPPLAAAHGGTTRFVSLLFSGITSWFAGVWLLDGVLPPGVMTTVLTVSPPVGAELELEELDELELELACCGHGGTAIVWTSVPRGTVMVVEPGGAFAVVSVSPMPPVGVFFSDLPCVGQGGMLIVTSLRCLARSTVRVPGVWSTVETASDDEELLELELPPHAASPTVTATSTLIPPPVRAIDLILAAIDSPSARVRCRRVSTR